VTDAGGQKKIAANDTKRERDNRLDQWPKGGAGGEEHAQGREAEKR
jgi:hypothetical protein